MSEDLPSRFGIVAAIAWGVALALGQGAATAAWAAEKPAKEQSDDAPEAEDKGAKEAVASFFGSKETRSTNLKPFKKWTAALERYTKEAAAKTKAASCDAAQFNLCHYDAWTKFLGTMKGKDPLTVVKEVNKTINQAKYITDDVNWSESDYWATPGEFMTKFGDCEDYAIMKYMSLKILGFKDEELRVVAVKDMNLKVGHAILVAFVGGKPMVLDNQVKIVVEADKIKHYQPIFSINETTWWRHRPAA